MNLPFFLNPWQLLSNAEPLVSAQLLSFLHGDGFAELIKVNADGLWFHRGCLGYYYFLYGGLNGF